MAEKPIEYCFLCIQTMCMPRSDWAAWVQAVGSLIGLGIGIGVPYFLAKSQQHIHREEHRLKARAAAPPIIDILDESLEAMRSHRPVLEPGANTDADVKTYVRSLNIGPISHVEEWASVRGSFHHFGKSADRLLDLESYINRNILRIQEVKYRHVEIGEEKAYVDSLRELWFEVFNFLTDIREALDQFRVNGQGPFHT